MQEKVKTELFQQDVIAAKNYHLLLVFFFTKRPLISQHLALLSKYAIMQDQYIYKWFSKNNFRKASNSS